jgi:hypothetical protein
MLNFLLAAASIALAIVVFVGLGVAAHDGGAIPYQGAEFSSGI